MNEEPQEQNVEQLKEQMDELLINVRNEAIVQTANLYILGRQALLAGLGLGVLTLEAAQAFLPFRGRAQRDRRGRCRGNVGAHPRRGNGQGGSRHGKHVQLDGPGGGGPRRQRLDDPPRPAPPRYELKATEVRTKEGG